MAFTPEAWAAGKSKIHLKSTCTFVNRTADVVNPAGTDGTMSAAGTEAESIYAPGLDAPDNVILPRKSVTWTMGYGVAGKADVQLTVRFGMLTYPAVTFTS